MPVEPTSQGYTSPGIPIPSMVYQIPPPVMHSPDYSTPESDHKKSTLLSGILATVAFIPWVIGFFVWAIIVSYVMYNDDFYLSFFIVIWGIDVYALIKAFVVILGIVASYKSWRPAIFLVLLYLGIWSVLETSLFFLCFFITVTEAEYVWWFLLLWGLTELCGFIFIYFASKRLLYLIKHYDDNPDTISYEMTQDV